MSIETIVKRFKERQVTRVLAFGSSNTAHFLSGMHWFDCFEVAINRTYGETVRCTNAGVGGHSVRDLLRRFEDDAAFYKPHLVFLTVGGNDSNPDRHVSPGDYAAALIEMHGRFAAMAGTVVFQTYYAPDATRVRPAHMEAFRKYMDIVRRVAADCGAGLIDHYARWEPFRLAHPGRYAALMRDDFHVNYRGNMVMGLDIARCFGAQLGDDEPALWQEAREIQAIMDAQARGASGRGP